MFQPPTLLLRAPQRLCVIFSLFLFFSLPAHAQESTIIRFESQTWPDSTTPTENPNLLSFNDLVALSKTANPTGDLATRLDSLLTNSFLQPDVLDREFPPDNGRQPARDFVDSLDDKAAARVDALSIASVFMEIGCRVNFVKKLTDDIFELRVKQFDRIFRVLFFYQPGC